MRWWLMVAVVVGALKASASVSAVTPVAPPAAILIDAQTGQVLREQDADVSHPPGTLSHLLLLLLSLEEAAVGGVSLDASIAVSRPAALDAAPSALTEKARGVQLVNRIPLRSDKAYVLSDLLKATVVAGADDAAVAVAEALFGSLPAGVEAINARAQRLGMTATHFATIGRVTPAVPAGADTTTARDLARLAQMLAGHPQVVQWTSVTGFPFDGGSIALRNVNSLVGTVADVNGLFVAGTRAGGYSLVATAQRGGLGLIAVVLAAADSVTRYRTGADLLTWGFAHYERLEIAHEDEPLNIPVRILSGSVTRLTPVAGRTFTLLRRRNEERDLELRYQIPAMLPAPLSRREQIGEVIVQERGQLIAVIPLVSPIQVEATRLIPAAQAEPLP